MVGKKWGRHSIALPQSMIIPGEVEEEVTLLEQIKCQLAKITKQTKPRKKHKNFALLVLQMTAQNFKVQWLSLYLTWVRYAKKL